MSSDQHTNTDPNSTMSDEEPDDDYERAPPDFESEIDLGDATVPDQPVVVDVPGKGEASARLVKQKVLDDLRKEAAEGNGAEAFGPHAVVDILKRHYESPSFEGLTARKYQNSPAGYYDPFFSAIVPEMDDEGNL